MSYFEKSFDQWAEQDIQNLIDNQIEERLTLDYKRSAALLSTEKKKKDPAIELTKDVSAFANSEGGVIIYGIMEGKGQNANIPIGIDGGFDPSEVKKEWLESIIEGKIQRKIPGVRIYPVKLDISHPSRCIYIIDIPKSHLAPHQAADRRYYLRNNFQSVPMEDYQVRDVLNRFSAPDLYIDFQTQPASGNIWNGKNNLGIALPIINKGIEPVQYAVISIWLGIGIYEQTEIEGMAFSEESFTFIENEKEITIPAKKYVYEYKPPLLPIFGVRHSHFINTCPQYMRNQRDHNGNPIKRLAKHAGFEIWSLGILEGKTMVNDSGSGFNLYIKWEIQAPRMQPREAIEKISYSPLHGRLKHKTISVKTIHP